MTTDTASTTSPTLGFSSLEREVVVDELPMEGQLPPWLAGSLLRTGPAKFEVGDQRMRHWFDGLAMLHRFTLGDGHVSYASRFLESDSYRAAREQGTIAFREFGTDPCRALFKRVQSLFSSHSMTDNANVNVAKLGERFIAMTESPLPVQFDRHTLEAAGVHPYRAPGQLSTAHPHADRSSGAMLNYAAKLGARSSYRFFELGAESSEPRVVASTPVDEPAYMHSFGLTERFFVLAEFPFVVNPPRLALSGKPYIANYRWKPELGTRFTLIDRETGEATGGFTAEACFAFHHVNAFERDGEVVVDLCVYPDAGVIEDLYLDRLRASKPMTRPALTRYRLGLADRTVEREPLGDGGLELPRINYSRCNARPYRYVWGTDVGPSGFLETIAKVDVVDQVTRSWSSPGCYAGEPVFVAAPGGEAEDNGILLSVVLDAHSGRSFLLVLDAASLEELARAHAPHHIPFGIHGQFARD